MRWFGLNVLVKGYGTAFAAALFGLAMGAELWIAALTLWFGGAILTAVFAVMRVVSACDGRQRLTKPPILRLVADRTKGLPHRQIHKSLN